MYTLSSKYFRKIFVGRIKKIYSGLSPDRTNNLEMRQRNINGLINNNLQTTRSQRPFGKQ